ncbi:MAG: trimeric autotransporter adhesin, partial [Patescibacteria group bacterium]|nr:trimeric autotransporter adhesin [Patescibacteria group bacterium]
MQYILGQNNKTGRYGFFKVSFFILAIFILANQIYQSPIANSASVSTNLLCASQRDLQIGMIGDDVKQLQQYLNQTDFPVALSGVGSAGRETNFFGPLTQSALIKFQQSQGVKSNLGFLDKNNNYFSCLEGDKNGNKIFQFERDLQIGMIGDDVKQLQQYLNQTDFPVALSGVGSAGRETNFFGPLTQTALSKFQNNHLINILDQPKLTRELGSLLLDTRNFINNKFDQELAPEQSSGDYSIGGTITGLAGEVILKNNDSDIFSLNVGDNSNFVFAKKLFDQAPYNVTIESKYSPQFCYLHNNIGTVSNGNVTNIGVACGVNLYYNPFVYRPARSGVSTYTLQYTAGANGSISGESSQLVNRGASGSAVTAQANTGYSFVNWSDALVDNPRTDTNVLSNISVTANFTINSYTITFDKNTGDTEADPTTRTTNYNTTVTLPVAPTKVGHTFDSWNTQADGNGSTFDNSTAVVANATVYAKWIINSYTITFDKNTGDSEADPTTRTTNYNTTVTLPVAPTKVGHTFDSWNTQADGNGSTFDNSTAVVANATVYAKWTALACGSYTVVVNAITYGTVATADGECWLD